MENFKKKKYQKPHELLNFNILGTFLFTCNENIFNNVIFLPFFIQQQLNKTLFLHFFCFKLYGKTLFSFCSYFSHQKHKEDQAKKKEEVVAAPAGPSQEELLTQIRDLLKK